MMVLKYHCSPIFLIQPSVSLEKLTSKFWRKSMLFCGISFSSPALLYLQTFFLIHSHVLFFRFRGSFSASSLVSLFCLSSPCPPTMIFSLFLSTWLHPVTLEEPFPCPSLQNIPPLTSFPFSSYLASFCFLLVSFFSPSRPLFTTQLTEI